MVKYAVKHKNKHRKYVAKHKKRKITVLEAIDKSF